MDTRSVPELRLPGIERILRPDLAPVLSSLLAQETEGDDDVIEAALFERLAGHSVFEYAWNGWTHPASRFPMPYTDVSLVSAAYALPLAQARALLPSDRLTPVRITPRRALMLFFGFDYRRGGLGAYREFGAAIPVLLDAPRTPPFLPLLRDWLRPGTDPRLGMFAVELPVDRERACEAGIRLYGLPKLVGEAHFELRDHGAAAQMSHDGRLMARIAVDLDRPNPRRRYDLSFNTLSVAQNRIVRASYATVGSGYRGWRARSELTLGDHPRFARFRSLSLSARPVEVRVIERLNWIIWGPQDCGPA